MASLPPAEGAGMTAASPRLRVAVAGASSLRGKEVVALAEERLPHAELRLVDDEADGVLTAAGGEPAIIQGASDGSFEGCRFVFFAGSTDFTLQQWQQAVDSGATVIDLSGALRSRPESTNWIPALRARLGTPPASVKSKLYVAPPAPVIIVCSLAAMMQAAGVDRLLTILFQPVSERGRAGIEELEKQTINLLSLKPITQELYGEQVAFNLLGRYGVRGQNTLANVRTEIVESVADCLGSQIPLPEIQVVQTPVFHGYAFLALLEGTRLSKQEDLQRTLHSVGVKVMQPDEAPSNISVAGETQIVVAPLESSSNGGRGCWLWGAADNLRLAAANALSIAETLLAS